MAAAVSTLVTFEDAVDRASEQGVTKIHVVRDPSAPHWTAIVARFNGAHTATAKGHTFEDAVITALLDAGVSW